MKCKILNNLKSLAFLAFYLMSSCGIQGSISSSKVSAASSTGSDAIVQGGNYFGAPIQIGTIDSQIFQFLTYGLPRVTILTTGEVGIGIETPSVELHVHDAAGVTSDLKLTNNTTGTSSSDGFTLRMSSLNASLKNYEAGDMIFETGGNEKLRILSTGELGVGTATPRATLDVNGYARLLVYSAMPAACTATNNGSIALTSQYTICVCRNSVGWVLSSNGSTACSW